ncbi:signal peptidase I [bacterium]|nr:signal peptidase I [bacterium]
MNEQKTDDVRLSNGVNDVPVEIDPQKSVEKQDDAGGFLKVFLITVSIALVIRIFIAQPFVVNGESMVPTFENGDYLIVDELSYHLREPVRGEVVVFRFPQNPSKFFIKRIVGLPGETLEIKNNSVFITRNDVRVELNENFLEPYSTRDRIITLDEGEYFVMGDNREQSSDSRTWGPVTKDLLIGRAFFRFLPITQIDVLPGEFLY